MHLPWVDFLVCEGSKNRSASSQCYFKKQSPEENFIVINKLIVVKLKRAFVKFVTVILSQVDF